MKTKTKSSTPRSATGKKLTVPALDGKPKVKQGTGRSVLFMSDTLFDDDLK